MTQLTRRRALRGVATSGIAALMGCLGASDPGGNGDDDGANGDAGDDDESGGEGNRTADDGNDDLASGTRQVGTSLSGPAWDYRERVGFCVLIREERDGGWLFADADAGTKAFVSDTDFETSVLLYVESVGPNTCYDEVEFGAFDVANGTLLGDAAAVDATGEDEVCGQALTYPGALVRVTTDARVDRARVTVTNGWGERATVRSDDGVRDPASLDGYVRPAGDPESVPAALGCEDDGFERHAAGYNDPDAVSWGSASGIDGGHGLELRVVNTGYDGDDGEDDHGDGDGEDRGDDEICDDDEVRGDVENHGDEEDRPERPGEALTFTRGDEVRIELTNVSSTPVGIGNPGKYNLEVLTEEGWTEVRGGDEGEPFVYTDELLTHPPGESVEWTFATTEAGLVEGGPHADRLRVCPELRPGRYRFVFWGADDVAVAFDYAG